MVRRLGATVDYIIEKQIEDALVEAMLERREFLTIGYLGGYLHVPRYGWIL